eukprot:6180301-Pleurochrysis_carterae.AAC.1
MAMIEIKVLRLDLPDFPSLDFTERLYCKILATRDNREDQKDHAAALPRGGVSGTGASHDGGVGIVRALLRGGEEVGEVHPTPAR